MHEEVGQPGSFVTLVRLLLIRGGDATNVCTSPRLIAEGGSNQLALAISAHVATRHVLQVVAESRRAARL